MKSFFSFKSCSSADIMTLYRKHMMMTMLHSSQHQLLLSCAAEESEVWQRKRKERTVWVKPWLALREKLGAYQALVMEFTNMARISTV